MEEEREGKGGREGGGKRERERAFVIQGIPDLLIQAKSLKYSCFISSRAQF